LSFTVAPTGESQWTFGLSNGSTSDQVSLTGGDTYALEIGTPAAVGQNNFHYYCGGAVATDGQKSNFLSLIHTRHRDASMNLRREEAVETRRGVADLVVRELVLARRKFGNAADRSPVG
jgi:hypothetical protein